MRKLSAAELEREKERLLRMWRAFAIAQERDRARREANPPSAEELLERRIRESRGDTDPITRAFLACAVDLWIHEFRYWSPEARVRKAHELADVIAFEQGVAVMCDAEARGTGRKGALGEAFNAVAQGLALLAYCPGGVTFAGQHWEAQRAEVPV